MERKEAIEVVKKNYPHVTESESQFETALRTLIPELKESEDERIWTINYLNNRKLNSSIIEEKESLKKAIAWLEKQGEQKPAWSGEDERMLDEIIDFFENGTVKLQHDLSLYASWLKFIKNRVQPQNTWKPSDEQMKAVKSASLDVAKFSSRSEQLRLENEPYYKALVSLYNDLKKIKEE